MWKSYYSDSFIFEAVYDDKVIIIKKDKDIVLKRELTNNRILAERYVKYCFGLLMLDYKTTPKKNENIVYDILDKYLLEDTQDNLSQLQDILWCLKKINSNDKKFYNIHAIITDIENKGISLERGYIPFNKKRLTNVLDYAIV